MFRLITALLSLLVVRCALGALPLPQPGPRWHEQGRIVFLGGGQQHDLSLADFGYWNSKGQPPTLTGVGAGPAIGLTVRLILSRPRADQLVLEAQVSGERDDLRVKRLELPALWSIARQPDAYLALPLHQGCLVPGDWDAEVEAEYQCQSGMLCMNWWGQRSADRTLIATLDTFWDYSLRVRNHPPQPPQVSVIWESRMGRFAYPRRVTYTFLKPGAGYVEMAQHYRQWSKQRKLFVPLDRKIKTLPAVRRMVGSIMVPLGVAHEDRRPGSPCGSSLQTFETLAGQLQAMHDAGLSNAYIHVDGWGTRGYDALEPAHLPPSPPAGGWEGFVMFSKKAERLGYLFGLHDNYWALYRDSPAWDEELTQKFEDQTYPLGAWWYGGEQSLLCPSYALQYQQKNVGEMLDHGLRLSAYYLDVFSADRLQECLDPDHLVTREQCAKLRGDCLRDLRSRGWVVSSECGADWSIPLIDAAYSITHPGLGVTVPFFSLVYHDALLVHGNGDFLDAALWGQQPVIGFTTSRRMIAALQVASRLFQATATRQMLWHRFLAAGSRSYGGEGAAATEPAGAASSRNIEEAGYSGGVTVAIDRAQKRWRIRGVPGFTGDWEDLPPTSHVIACRVSEFKQIGPRSAQVTFEWTTKIPPDEPLRTFCHLTHPDSPQGEKIVGGCDHKLPDDAMWAEGQVVSEGPYTLIVPQEYAGTFELRIGFLSNITGGRSQVAGLKGYDAGARGLLGKVVVEGTGETTKLVWQPSL